MRKAELEKELSRSRAQNQQYLEALRSIRQVARDCITKGTMINHTWIVEKVTEEITKAACK